MKKLIVLFIAIASISLLAQDKNNNGEVKMDDQTNNWMMKISSDPDMRVSMMNMMMLKTSGNEEQMMKLVNTILDNPEMNKMISSENNVRSISGDNPMNPEARGMVNDNMKMKEMIKTKPVPKK